MNPLTASEMHDLLQRCAGAVGLPSDACLLDELVPAILALRSPTEDKRKERMEWLTEAEAQLLYDREVAIFEDRQKDFKLRMNILGPKQP